MTKKIPKKLEFDVREMVLDIVAALDYDHYKDLLPETAEEPESAEANFERLVAIAKKHLKRLPVKE